MKNNKKQKFLKKIRFLSRIKTIFLICLLSISLLFLLLSYVFKINNHDFLSALSLNVFAGLLTGLIITFWDNITLNKTKKQKTLVNDFYKQVLSLRIPLYKIDPWDSEFATLVYKDVEEEAYYAKEFKNGFEYLFDLEENIKRIKEYYPKLFDSNQNIISKINKLKSASLNIKYQAVFLPKPIFLGDPSSDNFRIITAENGSEYLDLIDENIEADCDVLEIAFWIDLDTKLENDDYKQILTNFDILYNELKSLEFNLENEINDSIACLHKYQTNDLDETNE